MISYEFYLINATTVLLWLFQNFDHRVLIGLIALGAVCVIVSLCVISYRLVCALLFISDILLYFLLQIIQYIYFSLVFETIPRPSQPQRPMSNLLHTGSNLLHRFALDNEPELVRNASQTPQLSLPQALALHPNQWAELDARSNQPSVNIGEDSSRQLAGVSERSSQQPLRRSRRIRRTQVCDPCIHSN